MMFQILIFVTNTTKKIHTALHHQKNTLPNLSFKPPDLIVVLWCCGFVKSVQLSQQRFFVTFFTGNFLSDGSVMVLSW